MIENLDIIIPIASNLKGILSIPEEAKGLILFAHGSGSSRFSSRNQYVAKKLQEAQFATLLFDLLTAEEESVDEYSYEYRFDIPLLAIRLVDVTKWCLSEEQLHSLPIAYFGASTGAAAALIAASQLPEMIKAVVSRGGRPDLAEGALNKVKAPTLLIIGGLDTEVIQLNECAFIQLNCPKKMEIVPGATHLFEEPGKLEEVVNLSSEWFVRNL